MPLAQITATAGSGVGFLAAIDGQVSGAFISGAFLLANTLLTLYGSRLRDRRRARQLERRDETEDD